MDTEEIGTITFTKIEAARLASWIDSITENPTDEADYVKYGLLSLVTLLSKALKLGYQIEVK